MILIRGTAMPSVDDCGIAMFAILLTSIIVNAEESQIRSDEVVTFYPTAAHFDAESNEWIVPIHGIIFEPEESSLKRRLFISVIRRSFGLKKNEPVTDIFKQRVRLFLVDNERGKEIAIRIAGKTWTLPKSAANGHFQAEYRLSQEDVAAAQNDAAANGWLRFAAITKPDDERQFVGRLQLIPDEGFSLVSDIDDTIKHSQVTDKKELVRNTFLRPFTPALGMAELYQALAEDGWAFHYVSASPWQLYDPLSEFMAESGFPAGTFNLRHFRVTDSSIASMFTSSEPYKRATIDRLLARWPRRRFVLIGDSGQSDPEIYGDIARRHSDQVVAVLIRNVTNKSIEAMRFQQAFRGLDQTHVQLFTDLAEVDRMLANLQAAD